MRAVVLAAGHGERLRPLTSFLPKPLLPIRGRPVVTYTLAQLAAFGCEAVAVNLYHLGQSIRDALGDEYAGVPLSYSQEPELLGTLGALGPLRKFLEPAELVLVINGDSLCRWPLRALLRRHRKSRADVTLLASKRSDPEAFGGGIGIDKQRRIVSFRPTGGAREAIRQRVFMGAHTLEPRLLGRVPDGPADFVTRLWEPLMRSGGKLVALESSRRWHDLGTPERYRRAALSWGRRRGWVAPRAEIAASARLQRSVVEAQSRIGSRARIVDSIVLKGARVGRRCRVVESILGPGVDLPDNTAVERRMVTMVRADAAVSEAGSVVGGLAYEPI